LATAGHPLITAGTSAAPAAGVEVHVRAVPVVMMVEEPAEEPVVVVAVVAVAVVVTAVVVVTMPAAGPVTPVVSDGVLGKRSPRGRDEKRPGQTGGAQHALEHYVPF
jgi:hypothetical protein